MGFYSVLLLILVPAIAGLVCLVLPDQCARPRRLLAGAAAAAAVVLACFLVWSSVTLGQGLLTSPETLTWFRADGLSALVLVATTVFGLLITVYSSEFMAGRDRLNEYYAYLLWTIAASCGAILANDLVLLLAFWGFLGLTLYMMIGLAGPDAAGAAKKTFIIIGGSDCLLLLGIALVWMLTGSTRLDQEPIMLIGENAHIAFLCLAAAAFAKAGVMPFHSWVPDCGEKAPVPVTALLPASLDKLLGIYLLARTATGLFEMNQSMSTLLMAVGAGTIILAVMMALIQHDMKRLLSYHAVSQVGYMVLGIGTGIPIGIAGGLFHMLNNAVYKSCLFLCAGAVEKQTGTTDLDRLGGLARCMPITFAACLVSALSISGVPPLNGFASKWMVYQGVVEAGKNGGYVWVLFLAAAMLGSALTLASFVKILHAAFLCKRPEGEEEADIREVGGAMWVPMAVLAAVCVLFGVFAFQLPVRFLITPAMGGAVSIPGTWLAGPATAMLIIAFLVGLVLYYKTSVHGARECRTYIGGEIMADAYISGLEGEAEKHVEVTGVDFYSTVRDLRPFASIYEDAEKKFFDVYDLGTRLVFYFVEALRKAHSGRLPSYLTWVLAGLLVLLIVFMRIY